MLGDPSIRKLLEEGRPITDCLLALERLALQMILCYDTLAIVDVKEDQFRGDFWAQKILEDMHLEFDLGADLRAFRGIIRGLFEGNLEASPVTAKLKSGEVIVVPGQR